MNWLFLAIAIGFEVLGTTALKLSEGLTKPWVIAAMIAAYALSFVMLGLSIRTIPVSVAYAIWSGVGTAMIVIIGVYLFQEGMTWLKALFVSMVIIGAAGLKFVSPE